ncbi:hypothetical protein K505DRAFT_397727 [Melanomma pulvis-pyrius CBS 109.77]|uniref:Uncharacterized protein n=1 Tax=Melanomma pulvis-pyrius CBS 109.77 TaxID=1314802 RepID=A0A6A6WS73_9PLEO|nr:hypothetical protein K505DRAFT_397727 [Melanomma pulvis-pyrius CBS 109.77]
MKPPRTRAQYGQTCTCSRSSSHCSRERRHALAMSPPLPSAPSSQLQLPAPRPAGRSNTITSNAGPLTGWPHAQGSSGSASPRPQRLITRSPSRGRHCRRHCCADGRILLPSAPESSLARPASAVSVRDEEEKAAMMDDGRCVSAAPGAPRRQRQPRWCLPGMMTAGLARRRKFRWPRRFAICQAVAALQSLAAWPGSA